nr:hypothetical protein CFP56_00676 [Quercus suber]
MSHKRAHPSTQDDDHVPFGIRAIERGIEVEGVYVSRGNTPDLTSRATSTESSAWVHASCKPQEIDLEKQNAQLHSLERQGHSTTRYPMVPGNAVHLPRNLSLSAHRLSSRSGDLARALPPFNTSSKLSRNCPSTSSHARFGSATYIPQRDVSTTATLEGFETIQNGTKHIRHDINSAISQSSSGLNGESGHNSSSITASAPMLFSGRSADSMEKTAVSNFGLLDSHRVMQAAETGQLAPRSRSRKPSLSGSVLSLNTSSTALARYLETCSRSPSAAPSPTSPTFDTLPASLRRSSAPDVQSFDQFCQSAPHPDSIDSRCISPVSELESSSFRPRSRSQLSDCPSARVSQLSLPILESDEALQPSRRSFEVIPSQILRGHGTGFEVLSPGSLSSSQVNGSRRSGGPPIALHNASVRRARSRSSDGRVRNNGERCSGLELSKDRRIKAGGF